MIMGGDGRSELEVRRRVQRERDANTSSQEEEVRA